MHYWLKTFLWENWFQKTLEFSIFSLEIRTSICVNFLTMLKWHSHLVIVLWCRKVKDWFQIEHFEFWLIIIKWNFFYKIKWTSKKLVSRWWTWDKTLKFLKLSLRRNHFGVKLKTSALKSGVRVKVWLAAFSKQLVDWQKIL